MAEVLHRFESAIVGLEGERYGARACGRERDDGMWEGWIELVPEDGSPPLRSPRETTQPNRTDLVYWATGLTPVYLEGALERTLRLPPPPRPAADAEAPAFPGPAPDPPRGTAAPPAILDPFSVAARGGDSQLRKELGALSAWHLRNVARAYGLVDERRVDLDDLGREELVERIAGAVARRQEREATTSA